MQRYQFPIYNGTLETSIFYKQEMHKSLSQTANDFLIKHKTWISIHAYSDKAFKGITVNRPLPALHGSGYLKLRLLLIKQKSKNHCSAF